MVEVRAVEVFMRVRVVQVVKTVPVVPIVQVIRLVRVVLVVRWSGRSAWMICFQKIYGFHALNHQIIEKS